MSETEAFVRLTADALDEKLQSYLVIREVGHGSMGIVFEALQKGVGRRVAVKVLPPSLALRERTVKRFLREAEAMGRLSHPNIVDIYEIGSVDSLHYFAMRYVEGPPLDTIVKAGPMAIRDVVQIGIDVADALAHAHSRGVLHRDIKPSNLLRDGERVVLTDFGLARQLDAAESAAMTESGDIVGTPLYMSPEQIAGQLDKIDGRSDVWGLGATLYEFLLQHPPFRGSNASAILSKILHKDPALLRKMREDVPRDLEAVILKCLEKDQARRYSGAAALAADLRAIQEGGTVSATPPHFFDPLVRWVRRHPGAAAAIAAGMLVLAGLGGVALESTKQAQEAQQQKVDANDERDLTLDRSRQTDALNQLATALLDWIQAERELRRLGAAASAEQRAIQEGLKDRAVQTVSDIQATFPAELYPEVTIRATTAIAFMSSDELEASGDIEDIQLKGSTESGLRQYAALFVGLGRYEEALRAHDLRIELDDQNAGALLDAGRMHIRLGELAGGLETGTGAQHVQEATELLTRACSISRATDNTELEAQVLTERAWCHEQHGRLAEARNDLDRALALDSTLSLAAARLTAIREELRANQPRLALGAAGVPSDQLAGGIRSALGLLPGFGAAAGVLEVSEAAEAVASERIGDLFEGMRDMINATRKADDAASPDDDAQTPAEGGSPSPDADSTEPQDPGEPLEPDPGEAQLEIRQRG